jgi:hypothetical protein
MRALNPREKRTVIIGAVLVTVYLVFFGGVQAWTSAEKRRTEYQKLAKEAADFEKQLGVYKDRAAVAQKLMEGFHLDPVKLSRSTSVAEASAAIQKAAMSVGIALGPIRESPARAAGKELAAIQLEGTGPVPSMMGLLNKLETVGFPIIVETVQLTPMPGPQGMIKMNLTLVILDFEQWKKEAPNA